MCCLTHPGLVTATSLLLLHPVKPNWFLPSGTCWLCIGPSLSEMLLPNTHMTHCPISFTLSSWNVISSKSLFPISLFQWFPPTPISYPGIVQFSFTLLWVSFIALIYNANSNNKTLIVIFSNDIYYFPGFLLKPLFLFAHLMLCIT